VTISVAYLIRSQGHSVQVSQEAVEELQKQRESLEETVRERTRDLQQRSIQLQVAAEVARDATTAHELDELLNQAVDLIRDRFGFYHAGIFLVDESGEYAILRAATGAAGRQMLEQGHRLKVGEVGIVGYVTDQGTARIALDVGTDAVHFANPLLPETRSEMALPLQLGERVIGALDVQSREASAFDEDDVAVLQTMADQLAVAIENVRLLHQMQETVRELEVAYGHHTQEAWRTVAQTSKQPLGYRYRRLDVEPVVDPPQEARQAWLQGQTVATTVQPETGTDGQGDTHAVAVPIKFRDQVIGVFDIRSTGDAISPEAMSLVEEVVNRLALALENARLLEETQRRAVRDRLTANITAQVRSSMDPETILQTAVRELGAALGTDRTFIKLSAETQPAEE